MKKNIIIMLALTIALTTGLWFWASYQEKNAPATLIKNDIVLFYGKECPHCQDLDAFIKKNNIAEKVNFDSLEVWHNKANSNIMLNKAEECGFAKDQLGVPFLSANGKCFIGGPAVEKFFTQAAGI
ncbi:MAG: hypothetical protein WC823_03430 [Parcubacteria group bacterium]|jgi:glutaredoxin-related protein